MDSGEDAPQAEPSPQARAPGLEQAWRDLSAEGRAGLKAATDAAKALRILVAADISLARSAFGRTLAFACVAMAFGASGWLLLMATLIVTMPAKASRYLRPVSSQTYCMCPATTIKGSR